MKKFAAFTVMALLLISTVAMAADDATVLLRYKFAPGQIWETVQTSKGKLPILTEVGGPNVPANAGGMVMTSELDMMVTSRIAVKTVDKNGVASADVKIVAMVVTNNMTINDQQVNSRVEYGDGKITMSTPGGQPMSADATAGMEKMLSKAFTGKLYPTGGVVYDAEYSKLMNSMMGMNLEAGDIEKFSRVANGLPNNPIKIGDTWQNSFEGPDPDKMSADAEMKLTGIETVNGHKIARIASAAFTHISDTEINAPNAEGNPMGELMKGMKIQIVALDTETKSNMHLDMELGQVTRMSSDLILNMEQRMTMTMGDAEMIVCTRIEDGALHMETSTVLSK